MRYRIIFTLALLNPPLFLHGLTVGVFDIKGDVAGTGGRLADLAQSEIQNEKSFVMRDRLSVQNMKTEQEKCSAGLKECPTLSGEAKLLDMYVTGEAVSLAEKKRVILKAVKAGDQKITALAVGNADTLEKSMNEAAAELRKKMVAASKDAGASQKWKLAVEPVRAADAKAQALPEIAGLDAILLYALSKRAVFDLIDVKSDDIVEGERLLSAQGFAPGAFAPSGSDYTHFVTATLKVYDEVRILRYIVTNRKTRVAVITDQIEWTDKQGPFEAFDDLAKNTENQVQNVLGKVVIAGCDPVDAKVIFESRDPSRPKDENVCKSPLEIENIPAGEYTVLFTHEERNTLTKVITVKPVETLNMGKILLPDIDMSLFQQASAAESGGKYTEANSFYSQFYTKYPKHRMATYAMYREGYVTQLRLKKVADGRKILDAVISRAPDAEIRSEAYVGLALGFKAEGDVEKANGYFRMLTEQYAGTTAAEFARECLDGKCSF